MNERKSRQITLKELAASNYDACQLQYLTRGKDMKIKFNAKMLIACALLAVACGHRGKEVRKSTSITTEEETLSLNGNSIEEDRKEIETKAVKTETNKDDGKTVVTGLDEEKLTRSFYKWLMEHNTSASESDAHILAEEFAKSGMQFPVFKHAFLFAHENENGPQLAVEVAEAYAKSVVRDALKLQQTVVAETSGSLKIDDISAKGESLISADKTKFESILSTCMQPKLQEIADSFAATIDSLNDEDRSNARKECSDDVRAKFVKEISARLKAK